MRTILLVLAAGFAFAGAAALAQGADPPHDVGSMAYPAPLPQGRLNNVPAESPTPGDTGRAAAGPGGDNRKDVGTMAYQAPGAPGATTPTGK